jgi:Pre-mRNA 3'-end-processing endonuclease polyadenylation factor C-term
LHQVQLTSRKGMCFYIKYIKSVAIVWDFSDIDDLTTMQVTVTLGKNDTVAVVEWEASPAGDVIADALIALIMHAQSSPASIRLTSTPCRHPRAGKDDNEDTPEAKRSRNDEETLTMNRLRLIKHTLLDQFSNVEAVYEGNVATYEITTDTGLDPAVVQGEEPLICTAKVAFAHSNGGTAEISVECVDKKLASNVQECLRNLARSLAPLET